MKSFILSQLRTYFGPKILKQSYSQKKPFTTILNFYAILALCKNSETFHVLIFDTIRTSKTSKQDFSPKKSSTLILSIHATVILCKKKEKNCECHFLIKLSFWAHFDPKTFQSDFSPRNHFGQFKGFALL